MLPCKEKNIKTLGKICDGLTLANSPNNKLLRALPGDRREAGTRPNRHYYELTYGIAKAKR